MHKLTTIDSVTGRTIECDTDTLTYAFAPASALLRHPALLPLPNGEAVLIGDYTTSRPACFHVPASLVADVRRAIDVQPVQA